MSTSGRSGGGSKPPDQKKVYMDWANHYLRKTGHSATLSDLKEISDGLFLPHIIQAVVHGEIPGIVEAVQSEEDRQGNIEKCIRYLEKTGISCATFPPRDICDGNMRAIYSLFYNLSHFKKMAKEGGSGHGEGGGGAPASRIARPISPGLKSTLSISSPSSAGGGSGIPTSSKLSSPSSSSSLTNGPAGGTAAAAARKGAGSAIMTSTHTFAQRRLPHKSTTGGENHAPNHTPSSEDTTPTVNGDDVELDSTSKSRLMKPGSTANSSIPHSKDSKLHHSSVSASNIKGGPSEGHTPPRSLPARSTSMSKLQSPSLSKKSREPAKIEEKGETAIGSDTSSTNEDAAHEGGGNSRPSSRLKHPSSGRTTPSNMSRSGLQRPSSRLAKPGFSGPAAGEEQESQSSSSSRRPDSQLKLQRKGSDGAVKKHRVNLAGGGGGGGGGHGGNGGLSPAAGHSPIESGSSSLPRNLPKGILSSGGGGSGHHAPHGAAGTHHHEASLSKTSELESSGSSTASHHSTEGGGANKQQPAATTGAPSSNIKKVPSLKKPNSLSSLRAPFSGKSALTKPSDSQHGSQAMPSAKEDERESSPASSTASSTAPPSSHHHPPTKLTAPLKKMSSASSLTPPSSLTGSPLSKPKLSRLAGPASTSKLLSLKQHPHVTSLSGSAMVTSGSTSSLDSCNSDVIKEVGVSPKIDGEKVDAKVVESKLDKSSVEREPDPTPSRPPPNTLGIGKDTSPSKESDILSPPAEFKSLDKTTPPRGTRRISPEGMSQEDSNNRPDETPPKSPGDEGQSPMKQEGSNLPVSESVERNLKNERESAGDSPSLVIPRSQEEGESLPSDETSNKVTSPLALDSRHLTSGMKIGNEPGSRMEDQKLKSKGFSQPETGQPAMDSPLLVQKSLADAKGPSDDISQHRLSREMDQRSHDHGSKPRARSLSPKSSHRVGMSPSGHAYLPAHMIPHAHGVDLMRTASNELAGRSRKPLKSSLRHSNSSSGVGRNLSSNSLEGIKGKVTISPRSSQLVYDPNETLASHAYHLSPKILSPDANRPISFGESSNSDSLSPPGSTLGLHSRQPKLGGRALDLTRKDSIRSTVSEKLTFEEEIRFLDSRLSSVPKEQLASTPELLESFENQLSSMKMDLANKDRMLTMYESSMADLSSKLHHLRRTLEQKDREIKHLTDEKSSWFDLEGRSLASRAVSEAGVLSDGCLSDSAMEHEGKTGKKKKKPWKRFSFRKNKKDGGMEHLSPNMDTESIISTRSSKSLKRNFSNRKTPDLMSISEYTPPESRYRDLDTKSTYTLDARSEFAAILPQIGFNDHEIVEVFDDSSPGAKVKVLLQPEVLDTPSGPGVNDSGYHGDMFSRQLSSQLGSHRDSIGSHSDCSSTGESSETNFPLGTLSVAPEASWVTMDTKICDIFSHHLRTIDPESVLGLSEDSIQCYSIGDQRRQVGNALLPPVTPYQAVSTNNDIKILMKGSAQDSCDSLSYKTLMNVDTLKSYMDMLRDTHWLVVMGTKGTCKTSLASGLARHLSMSLMNEEEIEEEDEELMVTIGGEVINYNIDKDGLDNPLKFIKHDLVRKVQVQTHPPIILLEGVSECEVIEKILVAAEAVPKKPYIIATLCSGSAKGVPLHQLIFHHPIRLITCKPNNGHINGILSRSLRRQVYRHKASSSDVDPVADRLVNWLPFLLEHLNYFINRFHSSVVDLGPRVFMSCPLQLPANEIESWFINLWNHFVIPYLMGAVLAGIETYTADPRLEWIDVREWVVESYPWQPSINVNKLQTLSPEDVSWNHAVRPQQSRFMYYKSEDGHIPEDTRSMLA